MYFRVRSTAGLLHNLQVPVFNVSESSGAGLGGLANIVVTVEGLPMSIGTILLLVFFVGLVIPYFLGGILYRKFVGRHSGKDVIPNVGFWSELLALIGVGCMFTFKSAKKRISHISAFSGYENL